MSQLTHLLHAIDTLDDPQAYIIMATVVKVEGSAYRQPGARMIILPFGQSVGMISGGCLEKEVSQKADWLTRTALFALQRYSTGSIEHYQPEYSDFEQQADEEEMLAFGLGCNGRVSVLFERLSSPVQSPLIQFLQLVHRSHRAGVIATVIAAPAKGSIQLGDRVYLDASSRELHWITAVSHCSLIAPLISQKITQEMLVSLTQQKNAYLTYQTETGLVELFIEYVPAPYRLVIFGAGYDAQPLVTLAKLQGWHVTVIDSRPHFARAERFPEADQVLCIAIQDSINLSEITNGAAVAVMSHSLTQDRHWLKQSLLQTPRYIGQLGPRYRTERLITEIIEQLQDASLLESGLEVLHYPIGLDIGGDTPESIALAIMAEMTATMNQRSGKMLKQRKISIHAE